jgi:acetyltransferase-like isoleucine patch superfamily enzyme
MIENFIPGKIKNYLSYIKKIGYGKFVINFLVQRVFRINSQVNTQVNFTSTIVGNNLFFSSENYKFRTSLAVSGSLYLQSINGIHIGNDVLIAPGVKIISANHSNDNHRSVVEEKPIVIGDNVWIGAGAIILPGVYIPEGCIVASGAVVTKSFINPKSIIAGVPGKELL